MLRKSLKIIYKFLIECSSNFMFRNNLVTCWTHHLSLIPRCPINIFNTLSLTLQLFLLGILCARDGSIQSIIELWFSTLLLLLDLYASDISCKSQRSLVKLLITYRDLHWKLLVRSFYINYFKHAVILRHSYCSLNNLPHNSHLLRNLLAFTAP
jgi:hypothetical protein